MTETLTLNDEEIRDSEALEPAGANPMHLKRGTVETSAGGIVFEDSDTLIFVEGVEEVEGGAALPTVALTIHEGGSDEVQTTGFFKPIGKFMGRVQAGAEEINQVTYDDGASPEEIEELWALWAVA